MNIALLIQTITPLYNQYVQNRNIISGTVALEIMWDIGDILKNFIKENKIAPHALFWKVYGKSEGTKNIVQKSYITREFQNRCHRIRNIFQSKSQIKDDLPQLKKFTAFREAMPFFDNQKYKLAGKEKRELLKLLNSKKDQKNILRDIRKLQKEKIGIKNPRTQKLIELEDEKKIFIDFYNFIFQLLKENPNSIIAKLKQNNIDSRYIISLAKNTNALSQDGLKFFDIKTNMPNSLWRQYEEMIKEFANQKSAVKIRRFRKIIPSERIVRLADMLYELIKKLDRKKTKEIKDFWRECEKNEAQYRRGEYEQTSAAELRRIGLEARGEA
ncbi:MAG: hypothetical protein ABIE14_03530 [Patescibacteria group bacterium]